MDDATIDETAEAEDLDQELDEFDPASMPLGTFAAFPVSDQDEYIPLKKDAMPGEFSLTMQQENAIDAMVKAVAQCEPTARRLEVQNAWRQELMDRGFHNLKPADNYGWDISGSQRGQRDQGPYSNSLVNGYYPTNVIGPHNDILVAALTRDTPSARGFPVDPSDDKDITAADAGNEYKHFLAHDCNFAQKMSETARYFCTDDRALWWMAPWADAQKWGYEDDTAPVVPETEGEADADPQPTQKRPRIRSLLKVYGKLSDKCPISADDQRSMPWRQIADEWDIAITKSTFPWIADEITGGGMGIAEIALDRVARQTVKLALQRTTGDSITREVTVLATWLRPEMYMDESCPKALRSWFWTTFPKGYVAFHAGKKLAFVRNEGMDEVLHGLHSRSGNGQNRRSLTEAGINTQLRLNNWVDLIDEFFRKCVPRVGLDATVWSVDKMRDSSVRVGVYEPANRPQDGVALSETMVQFPMPTHQPALPDFIKYFAGELMEMQTGAVPSLSANVQDDQDTLGQSILQNGNAMCRLTECWKALCDGVAIVTGLGVRWAARVQPDDGEVNSVLPGGKRINVKIADMQGGDVVFHPEGDANFPESWAQRQARWMEAVKEAGAGNEFYAALIADPRNAAQAKQFMPPGTVIAVADPVEKQEGEFEVLLATGPIPNPKKAALEILLQQLTKQINQSQMLMQAAQMVQAGQGSPQMQETVKKMPPQVLAQIPQHVQQLQGQLAQGQQQLQALPDQISSVPVRADGSEDDATEALVCFGKMNSAEGRRLSVSKDQSEMAAWQNLHMHWQQHTDSAKDQKAKNQQPLVPKVSATVAVDKLPPAVQTEALKEIGLPVTEEDMNVPLQPHEVTTETEGIDPQTGLPTKQKVSESGKKL